MTKIMERISGVLGIHLNPDNLETVYIDLNRQGKIDDLVRDQILVEIVLYLSEKENESRPGTAV